MITLNDYLYAGDTVLKILKSYSEDLHAEPERKLRIAGASSDDGLLDCAMIDRLHSQFLAGILYQLEHNDFLTFQSNRIREFYKYMAVRYPFLAFTFRGRIKSVIRSEEKFNGYITEYIYNYYLKHHAYPTAEQLESRLHHFRDFIAYRIVISMPKCHLKPGQDREQTELHYLYEIANALPAFLEKREFTAEPANEDGDRMTAGEKTGLAPSVRPYFRDYVARPKESGYRSLHIAFYDQAASGHIEVQLRTHEMDNFAEIGTANHSQYEQEQNIIRRRRDAVPEGACRMFDEAYERGLVLQNLDFSKVDVNMFTAYSSELMNDGCGLYHGRLILPFEHLSRFQNDLIG